MSTYIGRDSTDQPGTAPAGYEWERTPGRPNHWQMVRLPLTHPVWQAAQQATTARYLRMNP